MDKILRTTKVWCCGCEDEHEAAVYEECNAVLCKTSCPLGDKTVTLSDDAALWKAICEKSCFDPGLKTGLPKGSFVPGLSPMLPEPDGGNRCSNKGVRLYRLDITSACNFRCPICYADAGGKAEEFFIGLETVEEIAGFLQMEGAKGVSLSGGEPTLHPELEKIIAIFKKAGIKSTILTNGIRIAQEEGYAQRLKKSGLRRAYVQFDTLDPAVHEKMRGNDFVDEKKKALENCVKAKIKTSVISVIIKDNLDETGALLSYMKNLVPWFGEIIFVTAIRETGRFDLPLDSFVYKEGIIKSLVKTSSVSGINEGVFYPLPVYKPFGLNVSPESNVVLPVVFIDDKIELLEKYVDMGKFVRLLNEEAGMRDTRASRLKMLGFFLVSLKLKRVAALFRILFGYLTKMGRTYINYVLIENFLSKDYQDLACLDNCNAYYVGPGGKLSSACVYNQGFKSGHPWTRRDE